MPRKKTTTNQSDIFNLEERLKTAPCVPAIRPQLIEESSPTLQNNGKRLSSTPPFLFSNLLLESNKTVFNYVTCDNELERSFAHFLDQWDYLKVPQQPFEVLNPKKFSELFYLMSV